MKTQTLFKNGLIALTAFGLILTSCRKKIEEEDSNLAENYSMSEQTSDDIDAISDDAENGKTLSAFKSDDALSILGDCAVVTKDTLSSKDTVKITVDFGAVNCLGKDGKNRRGKIKIVRIGKLFTVGMKRVATTDGYYVNDNKVEAKRTVEFKGKNASGHYHWTIDADATITLADGSGTVTGKTSRTREWIEGDGTLLNRSDDVFLVSGTASGTKATGKDFTATITTPLKFKVSCHQIVSGVITITPTGEKDRVIDYGNGDCDGTATITIGKKSKSISAKK